MKASLFTALDIFGHGFEFNFRGKSKLKTKVGASISLVFFGSFIAYCVYAIRSIYKTSDPIIKTTTLKFVGTEGFSIDEDSPFLPVFYAADISAKGDPANLKMSDYITNPLSHFIFYASVETTTREQGSTISETESLVIPTIMCKDLKKKKASHYYLDKIVMADTEKAIIESAGVCLDMPEQKFELLFSNGLIRKLRVDVYNCAGQDHCVPISQMNDNLVVFCRASRANVNLKEYESPASYRLDTRINHFGINSLKDWLNDTVFYIDIQSIENVLNEHVFLDTVKNVAQYIYYREQTLKYPKKFMTPADEDYSYGWLKCDGFDEWRRYIIADFDAGTNCKRQNKYICPFTGTNMREKCPSFFGVVMSMDLEVSRTDHQREYAKVLSILGEIGGFYGLLSSIFSTINDLILGFIQKNLVTATFFPLLFPKPKKSQPKEKTKKENAVKKQAVEFIEDCLDINNIIREVSMIRHLCNLLLSPAAQDLLLLSSFAEFRKNREPEADLKLPKSIDKQSKVHNQEVSPLSDWHHDAKDGEKVVSFDQGQLPDAKNQIASAGPSVAGDHGCQPRLALRDSLEVLIRKNINDSEFELANHPSNELLFIDALHREEGRIEMTELANKDIKSRFSLQSGKPLINKQLAAANKDNDELFVDQSSKL